MDRRTETDVQTTSAFPSLDETGRPVAELPEPIEDARRGLEPGHHLAFEDAGSIRVVPLAREWTRIGRSLAADVRFDDATVSRRHALIVCQADGVRILDDRSLNGVYVNDERVEWSPLRDGDRIAVGRHTLWFLETSDVPAGAPAGG
jgi:pSer/pThr/pTyr-binding forkhead associated (FHA) protein